MILDAKNGLINVIVEPKLQVHGGRTMCTVQLESYSDVRGLGHLLRGEVTFSRDAMFPFTGYAALEKLKDKFTGLDVKNLRMHKQDVSPDPVAFRYEAWYEPDLELGEEENNSFYWGYFLAGQLESVYDNFLYLPDAFLFYPFFSLTDEVLEYTKVEL